MILATSSCVSHFRGAYVPWANAVNVGTTWSGDFGCTTLNSFSLDWLSASGTKSPGQPTPNFFK